MESNQGPETSGAVPPGADARPGDEVTRIESGPVEVDIHEQAPAAPQRIPANPEAQAEAEASKARSERQRAEAERAKKQGLEKVKHTRTAAVWTGLIVGIVVLILLLVFILQNLDSVPVHFLGWQWNLPQGIALLFAAIAGAIVVAVAGVARMIQIRRFASRKQ